MSRFRPVRVDPYWVVAGVLLVLSVAFALRHPYSSDLGTHIATVDRLREYPTDPGNPLVNADVPSAYYSPYTLLLAMIARLTGWSAAAVLAGAGPVVVAALLVGLRAFVRTLTPHRYAPLLALAVLLLLWGPHPRVWSGFVNLWGLPQTQAFPATAALALTFLFWTWLTATLDRPPRWPSYVGLGLLAGVIALTHPFTFVTAALGAAGIVAVRAGRLTRAAWLGLALAAAGWLAVLLLWPYYPFFALLGPTNLDDVNKGVYRQPWMYYGLVAVGLPALWLRARRARLDPLVVLFVGALLIVTIGWVTGRYALGRCWPGVLVAAQLALAVELPSLPAGVLRRIWLPVTAVALVAGFVLQGAHLVYALPRTWVPHALASFNESWPDYRWITGYLHRGDVLVTDDYYALRTVPAYGIRTIPSAWPDPFLTDQPRRWHDVAAMHDPAVDPSTRRALAARYHATWVLEFPGSWSMDLGEQPVAVGPQGQRLYPIPS